MNNICAIGVNPTDQSCEIVLWTELIFFEVVTTIGFLEQ